MSNGANRVIDEMVKFITDMGGAAQHLCKEGEDFLHMQFEKALQKFNLVEREELEIVKEMLVKAEKERSELENRLIILEQKLAAQEKPQQK